MAKKSGSIPGDVVRYVPAAEPNVAVLAIGILTLLEVVFAILFIVLLLGDAGVPFGRPVGWNEDGIVWVPIYINGQILMQADNSIPVQQLEAFLLGSAFLTLAAILSLYRKYFLPDVMIVKRRKLKYEDLM